MTREEEIRLLTTQLDWLRAHGVDDERLRACRDEAIAELAARDLEPS